MVLGQSFRWIRVPASLDFFPAFTIFATDIRRSKLSAVRLYRPSFLPWMLGHQAHPHRSDRPRPRLPIRNGRYAPGHNVDRIFIWSSGRRGALPPWRRELPALRWSPSRTWQRATGPNPVCCRGGWRLGSLGGAFHCVASHPASCRPSPSPSIFSLADVFRPIAEKPSGNLECI